MEGVAPPFYWPDTVLLNGCFRLSSFFQTLLYFHSKQGQYKEHVVGLAKRYPGLRALFAGSSNPKKRLLGETGEVHEDGNELQVDDHDEALELEDEEGESNYLDEFDKMLEVRKRQLLEEGSEDNSDAVEDDESENGEAVEASSMTKRQLGLAHASYGKTLGNQDANYIHESSTKQLYSKGDIKEMKLSSAMAKFQRNQRR